MPQLSPLRLTGPAPPHRACTTSQGLPPAAWRLPSVCCDCHRRPSASNTLSGTGIQWVRCAQEILPEYYICNGNNPGNFIQENFFLTRFNSHPGLQFRGAPQNPGFCASAIQRLWDISRHPSYNPSLSQSHMQDTISLHLSFQATTTCHKDFCWFIRLHINSLLCTCNFHLIFLLCPNLGKTDL